MSRSRRQTPILGNTTARSEKLDKRLANRVLRRQSRIAIEESDPEDLMMPTQDETSSTWSFDKDGKHYIKNPDPKWMRK